ncbi:Sorting and assembly machinery component 50 [Musa troglodytarum]|uniref:Sorting and assembly machinery component 50 n=1 Tax=Musa troglodytarum TaxID=320322 RepID=A0A9E7FV42_9LILI|nr:Sorting and assembly machinery component 50 [Musa troglodytarum]URE02921.1 Sorting and assembly machinery component 50 [Musa troglodytarum]
MAIPSDSEAGPNPKPVEELEAESATNDEDRGEDEDEIEEEEEEDGDDEEEAEEDETPAAQRENINRLFRRLSGGPVRLRVQDIIIRGNTKTKDALIEAEVLDAFRSACSMQELIQAAGLANTRLRQLDIFDSVSITLDSGPSELPGTANVVIDVVEARNPLTGEFGAYSKPEARSWSLEGSLKLKNLFGYGDIWDASGAYGFGQTSEISAGVSLPRFKAISTPRTTRVSLLSQDWLKFSSYKERLLGLSVGLISTGNHDLAYNLTWRNLSDPSHLSSKTIRRQLGHSLLSSLKYTYRIDHRDSNLRPTRGYALLSTSQFGGLGPDSRILRFIRQEFDVRGAFPLGFYNAAVNFGVAAGAIMPWGRGFMDSTSPLPERFYMGGHSSPICSLGGPTSLLGFKLRGVGPTDERRAILTKHGEDEASTSSGRIASPGGDAIGGNLAVTAFADLSFDLPLKLFRESGVHGHMFLNTGNLVDLTLAEFKNFSFRGFLETFRSSAGFGIIFPTRFFRMEINYCCILKQLQHDHGKTGIQFGFSTP